MYGNIEPTLIQSRLSPTTAQLQQVPGTCTCGGGSLAPAHTRYHAAVPGTRYQVFVKSTQQSLCTEHILRP